MRRKMTLSILFSIICLTSYSQTLHLFGGSNHDIYLGCLNCDNYNSSSIWNESGKYGSNYNPNSIWNKYGKFGNEYNSESPWNSYGGNPPVVVDMDGNFYGYFTINKSKSKRATSDLALVIYEYYDLIRDDVSLWYNKLF